MTSDRTSREAPRREDEVWELTGRARGFGGDPGAPVPGEELRRRAGRTRVGRTRGGRLRTLAPWLVAACLVAVALSALHMARTAGDGPPAGLVDVLTRSGEVITVALDDGTVVRLGPESRLRAVESGQERSVELEGRAFFGVAPDDPRPFVVRTPFGHARVLGTRFEVAIQDGGARVTVSEGRVAVAATRGDEGVALGPLQRGLLGPEGEVELGVVEHPRADLEWMGAFFVFQRTPLDQVAVELIRHFGRPVRLEGPALEGLTVTATFTDQGFDEILGTVCRITGIPCEVTPDGAVMGRGTGAGGGQG